MFRTCVIGIRCRRFDEAFHAHFITHELQITCSYGCLPNYHAKRATHTNATTVFIEGNKRLISRTKHYNPTSSQDDSYSAKSTSIPNDLQQHVHRRANIVAKYHYGHSLGHVARDFRRERRERQCTKPLEKTRPTKANSWWSKETKNGSR